MNKQRQSSKNLVLLFIGTAAGIYLASPCNFFTFNKTERLFETRNVQYDLTSELGLVGFRITFVFFLAATLSQLPASFPSAMSKDEDA